MNSDPESVNNMWDSRCLQYCTSGVAVYVKSLLKHYWSSWVHHIEVVKAAKLLKVLERERMADAHARR